MGTLGLAWTGDLKNAGGVCEKNGVSIGFLDIYTKQCREYFSRPQCNSEQTANKRAHIHLYFSLFSDKKQYLFTSTCLLENGKDIRGIMFQFECSL